MFAQRALMCGLVCGFCTVWSVGYRHDSSIRFPQDIAVLTTNTENCNHYKSQSENVNGRFACHIPDAVLAQNAGMKIPITQAECEVGIC